MKKNEIKLYNVVAPVWYAYWLLLPLAWPWVLASNFVIDSIVLIIGMYVLKICDKMKTYWKCIFSVYVLGFLADILGSGIIVGVMYLMGKSKIEYRGDELYLTIPGLIITSALIFVANYFISFRKFEKKNRLKMSIIFAVATAPYLFLVPGVYN